MAEFTYDLLDEDEQFEFDPAVDVLRFLNPNVQAGHLLIRWQASGRAVTCWEV